MFLVWNVSMYVWTKKNFPDELHSSFGNRARNKWKLDRKFKFPAAVVPACSFELYLVFSFVSKYSLVLYVSLSVAFIFFCRKLSCANYLISKCRPLLEIDRKNDFEVPFSVWSTLQNNSLSPCGLAKLKIISELNRTLSAQRFKSTCERGKKL